MTRITHRAYLYGDIRLLEHSTSSLYISEILKVGKAFSADQPASRVWLRFLHCTEQCCNVTTKFKFSQTFCLFTKTGVGGAEQLYWLVMSVTVPRLTRFPSESETDTTALTTADLSLLLVPGSTRALATPWLAERVMLRVRGLSRERDRSGALISTSLVGPRMLEPSFCLPTMVKSGKKEMKYFFFVNPFQYLIWNWN